jgi:hypothetical protein
MATMMNINEAERGVLVAIGNRIPLSGYRVGLSSGLN